MPVAAKTSAAAQEAASASMGTGTTTTGSSATARRGALKKSVDVLRSSELYTEVVVPPDGGWGWVVTGGAFFANVLCDGTSMTFGIFLDDLARDMGEHESSVSLANSIMTGVSYFTAPLVCGMVNSYGFRKVSVLGGALFAVAFVAASCLSALPPFLAVYGAAGGLGIAMLYICAVIAVSFYFERFRALATAIETCGSSVGVAVFPIVFGSYMKPLGWRMQFRALAAMGAAAALLSLTYRPLKPVRCIPAERRVQFADAPIEQTIGSTDSIGDSVSMHSAGILATIFNTLSNFFFPRVNEVKQVVDMLELEDAGSEVVSLPSLAGSGGSGAAGGRVSSSSRTLTGILKVSRTDTLYSEVNNLGAAGKAPDDDDAEAGGRRKGRCGGRCCGWCLDGTGNRPMYRDDILFGGSVQSLPEYRAAVASSLLQAPVPLPVVVGSLALYS